MADNTRFEPRGLYFHRSEAGYGWSLFIGKRIRWNSTGAVTRMWPRVIYGGDENCNRAFTFVLWPIGSLDVWWEPKWRTDADGMCEKCLRWIEDEG